MNRYKYLFTVFTPCYNSSQFIHRVFESLDSQTFRDFEWIVVNDASTDNTADLIRNYIKRVSFPVKFFDLPHNQMLAANYNLAFSNAEGELFVAIGHDDIYVPEMLELYAQLYEQYNGPSIGGLVGRCITQYGKITPKEFIRPIMNYWEYGVDEKGNYTGEAPRVIKTELLAKYMPFHEEDKLPPPIEEMMGCDGYSFITTNHIVRKYFVYENELSLSSNMSKYPLHSWRRCLLYINKFQYYTKWSFKRKLLGLSLYAYWSLKAKISFREAMSSLESNKLGVFLLFPVGYIAKFCSEHKFLHDLLIKKRI